MFKNFNDQGNNNNIKCIDSIIKYIDFESCYYIINLNIILFFLDIIFNDFDYIFLSMYF